MFTDGIMETIRPCDFQLFQNLIHKETGIWLRDSKHLMLCSRLSRRLRHHGFTDYRKYYEYLTKEDTQGKELRALINCITTNKTSFFREPHHFRYLEQVIQERVQHSRNNGTMGQFRVWSAACSTGEEPYSILMTIIEAILTANMSGPFLIQGAGRADRSPLNNIPLWDLQVLATDIDTDVLARAEAGVYQAEDAADIPPVLMRKYFLRGLGNMQGMLRVKPELRDRVDFRRLNFMDSNWNLDGQFDAIFCRNCLIYFDHPTQEKVIRRLVQHLRPGGHLFLGHSEHLPWLHEIVAPVERTTYWRPTEAGGLTGRAHNTVSNINWTGAPNHAALQTSYR